MRFPRPIGFSLVALVGLLIGLSGFSLGQHRMFRAWDDKGLDWRVLEKGYEKMMEDHARRLAFQLNLGRSWPESAAEIGRRQEALRARMWHAFGMHLLEKTDLKPQITGTLDRGDYTVEKLLYTSLPGVYVTANVYLPKDRDRQHPAVLFPIGHWSQGRFATEIQARAIGLAKLGFVVLSLDKFGYGERGFTGHEEAFYLLPSGMTLEGLQIWDNMRAIDYLVSRPDVDPQRIGITGCSGGGNQTMYTAALDTRIGSAVPAASVNTFDGLFFRGIGCVCESTPGVLGFADQGDILACIAPRPLFIPSTLLDGIFPVAKAREAYFITRRVYASLGAADRIKIWHYYDEHEYNREMRESVYGWLDHSLKGKPFEPLPEGQDWQSTLDLDSLRVVKGGKFPQDAVTLSDLAVTFARKVHRAAAFEDSSALDRYRARTLRFLRDEVFGGFPDKSEAPLRIKVVDRTNYGGWQMRKLLFWSDWDVIIPAVFVEAEAAKGTVVLAHSRGKAISFLHNWVEKARARGFNVLTVDLRGIGETGEEHRLLVQNGLVTGRPVLGEWIWDLVRSVDLIDALAAGPGPDSASSPPSPVFVLGDGTTGLAALLAPAFDARISGSAAIGTLATYFPKGGFGVDTLYYLPRVLEAGDLPELLALSAPARLVLSAPVWPSGEPVGPGEVDEVFRPLHRAFTVKEVPEKLVLVPDEDIDRTLDALLTR